MTQWITKNRRWTHRSSNLISRFRRTRRRKQTQKKTLLVHMTIPDIQRAIEGIKGYRNSDWQRIVLDNKYWVCTKTEFQRVVNTNTINEKQYVLDQFDCDNFAFAFKAQVAMNYNLNNVGLVIDNSGGHAYNIVVFNDGTAELFEPQTDRWITPGESKMYSFKKGIIIL